MSVILWCFVVERLERFVCSVIGRLLSVDFP